MATLGEHRRGTTRTVALICAGGCAAILSMPGAAAGVQDARQLKLAGEGWVISTLEDRVAAVESHPDDFSLRAVVWRPKTNKTRRTTYVSHADGCADSLTVVLASKAVAWDCEYQVSSGIEYSVFMAAFPRLRPVRIASGWSDDPSAAGFVGNLVGDGRGLFAFNEGADGKLWRVFPLPTPGAKPCPNRTLPQCVLLANAQAVDADAGRILAKRDSAGIVLGGDGRDLHSLRLPQIASDSRLRGGSVYVRQGKRLAEYNLRRQQVTRRWNLRGRSPWLEDVRHGIASYGYVDGDSPAFRVIRLADGRDRGVPGPRSASWANVAIGKGGVYYRYNEKSSPQPYRGRIAFTPMRAIFG